MNFQLTHPVWILALPAGLAWVIWLAWKTHVQTSPARRWLALGVRILVVSLVALAIAGLQWLKPEDGMNVFFLLDRSDSVPSVQQESTLKYLRQAAQERRREDRAGIIVFGAEAGIESVVSPIFDAQKKIYTVVGTERTDIGAAVRLGTAAFPERGQKRLVLLSDGNENLGDAQAAVAAAQSLGITVDTMPLGVARGHDVSIQKLSLPNQLKKGQPFEVKIFAKADEPATGTVRLLRNDQFLGEHKVELAAGKNLFSFPQALTEPGFYAYEVQLEVGNDQTPQNNKAANFTFVRGDPRVLVVSAAPEADAPLVAALRSAKLEVKAGGLEAFPTGLSEIQSFDAIFLSNIAAGDLGRDAMRLLESAVRDFGAGLVCIGGDQTYAAGGYRGTPLEAMLPVSMELDSKKVMPSGALVIAVHATEFPNGNQWARDIAFAALDSLGPQDEMGITLWDGTDRWLFPLEKVGDKKKMGTAITGMRPGDMPNFQPIMQLAHTALKQSTANLKHLVVFSDGDPGAPSQELMNSFINDKITVSSVMIGGHVNPQTMIQIATLGRGQYYEVNAPDRLPQIFLKEAAVILKSAIFEQPFKPQISFVSEPIKGLDPAAYPVLLGYVATSPKARAETPMVSDKGDPLLAHWQYGLGRAVAFTSDAKAKWGAHWIQWDKYRQFWLQIAQWSMRRIENAEYTTEVSMEQGLGQLSVEALDAEGNYRNFLNFEAAVVSPKGEPKTVRLEQTGPGRYEARFPTREIGAYMIHLQQKEGGVVRSSQVLGASINYSPEYEATEPNVNLLRRLAEASGGKFIKPGDPTVNPFLHDRRKTFQPVDLWEWLLKFAILLFPLDVALRRVYLDRAEWAKATRTLQRWLLFWRPAPRRQETDESLAALLARRDRVRTDTTGPAAQPRPELFRPQKPAEAPAGAAGPTVVLPAQSPAGPQAAAAKPGPEPAADSTAGRLLAAKRRAQKWKE